MCFSCSYAFSCRQKIAQLLVGAFIFKRFCLSKIITAFFIAVTTVALLVCVLAYHMIHKSTQRPIYTAKRQKEHEHNRKILLKQFHAQPITFETDDCLKLSGLLIVRSGAKRNLLLCHGYRMCKERLCCFASMFPDDNIFMFDHRAHGQSEGTRTTIGYDERKDVLAALNILKTHQKTKNLPTFGIGVSMGAVSLLGAACDCNGFKAIILDSPFAQLQDQARKTFSYKYKLPIVPFESLGKKIFEYLMQFSLDEVDALFCAKRAKLPIMIIHSTQDRVAPIIDAHQIYEIIQSKKEFWQVEGSSHARVFYDFPDSYTKQVNQFFNTVSA